MRLSSLTHAFVVAAVVLSCAPAALAKAPDKPAAKPAAKTPAKPVAARPTQAEIQETFDKEDFNAVLQQVAKVLPLKGDDAADYDRYKLLMMKAESHLRLKQGKYASDAFALAAKETKEPKEAAMARAMKRMLQEVRGVSVQRTLAPKPKDSNAPAIADVTDPKQRENALRIVFEELRAGAEPKIKEARRARTLPPIADAFTILAELDDFERVTGGSADTTAESVDDIRRELGERGAKLIDKELIRLEKETTAITEAANTVTRQTTSASTTGRSDDFTTSNYYRGLSEQDKRDLRDIVGTCKKLIPTAESLADVSGGSPKEAEDRIERAKDIERVASRALSTNYNGPPQRIDPNQQQAPRARARARAR